MKTTFKVTLENNWLLQQQLYMLALKKKVQHTEMIWPWSPGFIYATGEMQH